MGWYDLLGGQSVVGWRVFLRYLRASYAIRYALLAGVFGVLLAAVALSEGARTHRRVQDFYPKRAEVLAKYQDGGRGGPYYYFLIRYLDRAGWSHVRRVQSSKSEYTEARTRDEVQTYVSGMDAEDIWLASKGEPNFRRTEVLGTCAALALLPTLIVLNWLRWRSAVLLSGQSLAGRVEKVGRDYRTRFSTKHNYQLRWNCVGPDRRRRRGKSLHMSKQLASRWKRGDEIPVYFDRVHRRIAEVDVYGLRPTIGRTEGAP